MVCSGHSGSFPRGKCSSYGTLGHGQLVCRIWLAPSLSSPPPDPLLPVPRPTQGGKRLPALCTSESFSLKQGVKLSHQSDPISKLPPQSGCCHKGFLKVLLENVTCPEIYWRFQSLKSLLSSASSPDDPSLRGFPDI